MNYYNRITEVISGDQIIVESQEQQERIDELLGRIGRAMGTLLSSKPANPYTGQWNPLRGKYEGGLNADDRRAAIRARVAAKKKDAAPAETKPTKRVRTPEQQAEFDKKKQHAATVRGLLPKNKEGRANMINALRTGVQYAKSGPKPATQADIRLGQAVGLSDRAKKFKGAVRKGMEQQADLVTQNASTYYGSIANMIRESFQLNEKKGPCWKGYKAVGMKMKGGRKVPNCVPVSDSIERIGDLISEMIPVTDPSKTGYYGTNMFNELQSGKVGSFLKSSMANTPAALEKRLNRRLTGRSDRSDWAGSSQRDMARLSPRGGKGFGSTLPKPAMIPGRYSSKSAYISATSPEALRSTKELNPSLDTAIQGLAKNPNDFTKSKKYVNASIERIGNLITEVAAWQKKSGKNPSGGLNKKGVASYRKENPGSKLKTAVTTKPSKLKKGSKAANRRKSFCARMGGMKKSRTSAKTANNPDSRINKALRKWNC